MKLSDLHSVQQAPVKVTKIGAGYVHRIGVDYRCSECITFIPATQRCALHGPGDIIKPPGYCTYWAYGKPMPGISTQSSVTKVESGYGEKANGTKCFRCGYYDKAGLCSRVNENTPGDDPGQIHPDACCANHT